MIFLSGLVHPKQIRRFANSRISALAAYNLYIRRKIHYFLFYRNPAVHNRLSKKYVCETLEKQTMIDTLLLNISPVFPYFLEVIKPLGFGGFFNWSGSLQTD